MRLLAIASLAAPMVMVVRAAAGPISPVSLYLSPASGSFTVGSTFAVSIYVNTGGNAINAVQADLSFPADKLQVVSPDSGKSFIQIWVAQPGYSNTEGTLHFQGALPSPGITTSAGLVATITFRVINTGTAAVRFLDTSRVLLNDGLATNALSQMTNGIYTLVPPPPQGPIVTSPTNPDQSTWYPTSAATLQWTTAFQETEGFSYVLNDLPVDTPDDISEGTSTSVTYKNISDGVYYFHIKALSRGVWGGVTHFAVRVDNTPPASIAVSVSPGTYTSDRNIVLQFRTTDAASGIDYYDLKIIPLDSAVAQAAGIETPFFTEVSSPYLMQLGIGKYDVVVRAYDAAGNFTQSIAHIEVVNPFFEAAGSDGLRIAGSFTVPWWYLGGGVLALLALLAFGLAKVWSRHRKAPAALAAGAAAHPEIARMLEELKRKQKEYEDMIKRFSAVIVLAIGIGWGLRAMTAPAPARAANLSLDPPIINLYPSSLGNDEILYIGGWANAPGAEVNVLIEEAETGNTFSGTATVGPDGNWFYSLPQLLDPGHYAVWSNLKNGAVMSQPSARVNVVVSPTAIKIGAARLDYAQFYLLLFLVALGIAAVLFILMIVYSRRARAKHLRLDRAIRDAEASVRRGFAVLERDIQTELAAVQKLAPQGALSDEERAREAKLRADLDEVKRYVGKEIWRIEEEEEKG